MEKGIRYEKFKDKKVQDLLAKKDEIVTEGRKLSKEVETTLEKYNQQILKLKDKVKPLVDPYIEKMNLGEFEVPTEVTIEGDEIKVQIVDEIESYKELKRKQKEDGDKANSDTGKESDKGTA